MQTGAARWLLSLQLLLGQLLLGLTGPTAFAVGLKENATLESLRSASKADQAELHAGSSKSSDAQQVASLIDAAIDDVMSMPPPRDRVVLQMRLRILLDETAGFAQDQRQHVAQYAIKIWRAAGFTENSGLLSVPDQQILDRP